MNLLTRLAIAIALACVVFPVTAQTYDIVIKGGRVIDPASELDGTRDVGINKDRKLQYLAMVIRDQEPGGLLREPHAGAAMKLSARNTLPGTIRKIERGAVNAEVVLELAPGLTIVSIITLDAVDSLGLKVGQKAYAVIKASSVMVGTD